jgi:hypothetical protein
VATSRETFVVQVHKDGGAVIENLRTRECVWLSELSEIAPHITGSLDDRERDRPVMGRRASAKPPGGTT